MAALVESGVKNLNFGDADSVGFFQMRVGIWNQGEYAGFPEKPELQAKWFLDTAERSRSSGIAAASPSTTRASSASGSPTSSAPPSSTAAATSCASTRRRGCSRRARPPGRAPSAARGRRAARRHRAGCRARRSRRGRRRRRARRLEPPARPVGVRARRQGRRADAGEQALLKNKNITFDADRHRRHQGGQDRPARDRRDDQALRGAQDHGHVHVLGPLARHGRRLGLQPLARPRARHRHDRRRDRAPELRGGARAGDRAVGAARGLPAERDRHAVRDHGPRLLHRRRAPGPHPLRLQAGDQPGLAPARRRRRRRVRGARPPSPPRCPERLPHRSHLPLRARPRQPPRRPAPPKAGDSGMFMAAQAKAAGAGGAGRATPARSWPSGRRARSPIPRRSRARSPPTRRRSPARIGLEQPRCGGPEDR